MRYSLVIAGLTLAAPVVVAAQDVIKFNMSDIAFQWRPMSNGSTMCGYAVEGNHLSHKNPKTEWDFNIDEIVAGDARVAGVSAGSFVVSGKIRTPRAPITGMVFTTQNDADPLPVQFVGPPNQDNGVRGTMDLARATKLFEALSNERRIDVVLKYADGSSESIQFYGLRDRRGTGGGENNPFNQCLRGITPKPGSGEWGTMTIKKG